ncbi:MAG: type IV secretory system conjugative DNA transfer family protein [Rhodobacteraceae bacterium]|nr:type IV secretory system conjugative DNA transfer family protein [Paracoccaceae bacterium]
MTFFRPTQTANGWPVIRNRDIPVAMLSTDANWRPRSRLFNTGLAHLQARAGLRTEFGPCDPMGITKAPAENTVIGLGGAGSGKTQGIGVSILLTYDGPVVVNDLDSQSVPRYQHYRCLIGRQPYIFDPRLGSDSASTNVLEGLHPGDTDWETGLSEITEALFVSKEHTSVQEQSQAAFEATVANLVTKGAERSEEVTLGHVRDVLRASDFADRLLEWAQTGHRDYQGRCLELSEQLSDKDLLTSVRIFSMKATAWLDNPNERAVVSGTTARRISASILVDEKSTADFFFSSSFNRAKQSDRNNHSASLRLLNRACMAVHYSRGDISGTPAAMRPTTFMFDETAQFGRSEFINDLVVSYRKFGCRTVLMSQTAEDVNRAWGADMMKAWMESADIKVITGVTDYDQAERICREFGDTVARNYDVSQPEGGDALYSSRYAREPLISPMELINMPKGTALIWTRHTGLFKGNLPFYWRHPGLHARHKAAMAERDRFEAELANSA